MLACLPVFFLGKLRFFLRRHGLDFVVTRLRKAYSYIVVPSAPTIHVDLFIEPNHIDETPTMQVNDSATIKFVFN